MSENIFADEWLECLEAHYMHVIRIKDKVTEPSLSIVMHSAGFSDKQLAELKVRATMHIDDVGEDFVPDLDVLDGHDHDHQEVAPEVVEARVYNIPIDIAPEPVVDVLVAEVELPSENDNLPEAELNPEELQEQEDETLIEDETESNNPDEPQQLSLF
jgi:hypothetical protein